MHIPCRAGHGQTSQNQCTSQNEGPAGLLHWRGPKGLIARSGPVFAARGRRMDLSALLPVIDGAVGLDRLRSRMSAQRSLTLGVSDGAKAAVIAALARPVVTPIVIITPKPQHADALADELRAWLGPGAAARVIVFPERDALPYERLAPDPEDVAARLAVPEAPRASSGAIVVTC